MPHACNVGAGLLAWIEKLHDDVVAQPKLQMRRYRHLKLAQRATWGSVQGDRCDTYQRTKRHGWLQHSPASGIRRPVPADWNSIGDLLNQLQALQTQYPW
jgi:hypothetical protein